MEKLVDHSKRERALTLFCVLIAAAFALSLLPLLLDARYNVPYIDDVENAKHLTGVWESTHSLPALFAAAAEYTRGIFYSWQGTFSSVFLMAAGSATVFTQLPALTPILSIAMLIFSVWFADHALLRKTLGADRRTVVIIACLELLLMLQFCPSIYEGFYWYCSAVLYLICWCALITLLGVLLYQRTAAHVGAKLGLFLATLALTVLIAGGSFTTILPAGALLLAFLIDAIRRRDRANIVLGALLLAAFCAGAGLNIAAPGNYARLAIEGGAGASAMSPITAVLMSVVHAAGATLNRFNPGMLLYLAAVAVLTARLAARSAYRFRMPWLVLLVTLGVYATMFVPLVYTKGNVGGLRVQNLYYFALFPLMGFNTAYWTGNLVKRAQGKDGGRALPESVRRTVDLAFVRPAVTLVVAALLLFSVCLQRGVLKTWSYAALQDVASGTAQANYAEGMAAIARGETPPAQLPDAPAPDTAQRTRPNIAYGN